MGKQTLHLNFKEKEDPLVGLTFKTERVFWKSSGEVAQDRSTLLRRHGTIFNCETPVATSIRCEVDRRVKTYLPLRLRRNKITKTL